MNRTRGVYFLANDGIIDLAIAFLNSFRVHNPSLLLCLIPYNSHYSRLKTLQDIYSFSILEDPEILKWCDGIQSHFFDQYRGHFRKLATWQGEFDEFIYIDVDTVILSNLDFVFDFLKDWDFVTSHSNFPSLKQWVWQEGIETTGYLTEAQINYSANTGFIASKKSLLNRDDIDSRLNSAIELKSYMQLSCQEQPLLNYLMVTSGNSYTSLSNLRQNPEHNQIKGEFWAGSKGGFPFRGKLFFPFNNSQELILLVHWAGEWQTQKIDYRIHKILYLLKLSRVPNPAIRYFMKYKRLWQYYRYLKYEIKT